LIYFGKFLKILFQIIFCLPKIIFKPLIFKIYHLSLKTKIKKDKEKKEEKYQLQYYKLKFKKTLPYTLLVIIGTLTIVNNLFAKLPEPEEFGKDTVLSKIIIQKTNEFFNNNEITEEGGPAVIAKKNTEMDRATIEAPLPQIILNDVSDLEPIPTMTTNQKTALLATTISEEATKEGPRDKIIEYTIEQGDTISGIAQKFNISVATILWSNNLTYYSVIKPGGTLKILPTTGLLHEVKKGESISTIAKKYKSDIDKILEANKLSSADQIAIGNNLIIPDGVKPAAVITTNTTPTSIFSAPKVTNTNTKLLWPTSAKTITQYYWWKHAAIDIGGPTGTPIYASESGTVEISGWSTGGYGYYIVINHGNGIKTLYAHASKLYVKKGEKVSRGQTIMAMGSTGWSTGPHLHFEVRVNGYKQNPLSYIK
jgi:murein DD-endopeptidase MepM/ murein hydrolase activator NlpD